MTGLDNNCSWVKFYPEDWLNNSSLRELDPVSRAVWLDLFSFSMLQITPGMITGYELNRLARILIVPKRKFKRALGRLVKAGLCHIPIRGCIRVQTDILSRS